MDGSRSIHVVQRPKLLILVGDIGGTNARFGSYADGGRIGLVELPTADYANGDDLLADALATLAHEAVEACCLAIAGPVLGEEARLTNADIGFSRRATAHLLGTDRVELVNDIVALGCAVALGQAVAELADTRLELLSGELGTGTLGVIAAGTGLGMGIVVDGECLPSEGGHARVAPVGAFERELLAVSESEIDEHGGIVAWEHYLSGRGIEALHRAVGTVWGAKPEPLAAEEITRRGLGMSDPICHTTLETWVGLLATAAGGLAVTALTLGGVYLAGSIPLALAEMLRAPLFRRRFEDAAWAADFFQHIPIYLVADPHIGLDGAHIIAEKVRNKHGA